jgi:sugar O-acyltransferase (sialic acid O-acetyltransferase NeuD family)
VSGAVIVLGAGGHAKVLIDTLRLLSVKVLGLTDSDKCKFGSSLLEVPIIGSDDELEKYPRESVFLVNGLGSTRVDARRSRLFEYFKGMDYRFAHVIHPSSVIASDVTLSEGVQIMAGVVIQTGCRIGRNTIMNTRVSLDHDCRIGDHVHISPGATLSGGVLVQDGSHIGVGASVIQGIRIGRNSLVAAGAVVIRDVPDNATVSGVPAREKKE